MRQRRVTVADGEGDGGAYDAFRSDRDKRPRNGACCTTLWWRATTRDDVAATAATDGIIGKYSSRRQ
jgi:hypothetical protein